jgi:hypothetical protein
MLQWPCRIGGDLYLYAKGIDFFSLTSDVSSSSYDRNHEYPNVTLTEGGDSMKSSICKTINVLSAATIIVGLMLLGTAGGWAQQKAGSPKDQLVGSWKILSYKSQTVGEENWRESMGANPKGYAIFTANGRFVQFVTASGRKPPTNDAERAALLDSMNAFSGEYAVEKDQLTIIVDTSWAEAHQGERQKQVRFFKIDGNKLTWRTPPQIGSRSSIGTAGAAKGKSVTECVWEREK